jgi:hypothetical protein
MAAKTVPFEGEVLANNAFRWQRVTAGFASTNDVVTIAQTAYSLFAVKAGTFVRAVYAYVVTAFTASVTLDIGDATDVDGFLATAKIAPTSADTNSVLVATYAGTAEAYNGGKFYSADTNINITVGGANPLAGKLVAYMEYLDLNSLGVPS